MDRAVGSRAPQRGAAGRLAARRVVAGAATLTLAGATLLGGAGAASAATTVGSYTVTASASSVEVGDTVSVTVAATGVTDLFAYELTVGFDPEVLEYVDGSGTTDISGFHEAALGPDGSSVVLTQTKLGTSPAAEGDLTLATLDFVAVGAGDGAVTAERATLVDAATQATEVTGLGTAPITVTAVAVEPTDPPTDEPGSGPGTDGPGTDEPTDDATLVDSDGGSDPWSTGGTGSGSLASTGATVGLAAGAAFLALLVGVGLVVAARRHRARQAKGGAE
ncbi:cohesin domain-containing protein [Oerskovia sp. NPDC060287]|uniref:cohesin domain-containing protein n=1 Tax=Oerskovia sp. NPDC060287 TaxID=3347095 RepID=UPI0036549951